MLAQPLSCIGSTCIESWIGFDLSQKEAGQESGLHLKNPSIADSIAKAGMRHQDLQTSFIGVDHTSAPAVRQGDSPGPRDEVRRAQFAVVDEANSYRICHQWAKLFHQIEGQGWTSRAWLVVKTQVRIEAHTHQRNDHLFREQGIEKRQQRIHWIAWGTAIAGGKRKSWSVFLVSWLEHAGKMREVFPRCGAFDAEQLL